MPRGRVGAHTIKDGKINKKRDPKENMILNNFFNMQFVNSSTNALFTSSSQGLIQRCRVGTGSSAILPETTALSNIHSATQQSRSTSFEGIEEIEGVRYRKHKFVFTFTHGAINAILTEVALYSNINLNSILCATLLKDETGAPAAFPVNDDEQLVIEYYVYWPVPANEPDFLMNSVIYLDDPVPAVLTIDGQDHDCNLYFKYSSYSSNQYYISGRSQYVNNLFYKSTDINVGSWTRLVASTQAAGTSNSLNVVGRKITYTTKSVIVGSVSTTDIKWLAIGGTNSSITSVIDSEVACVALLEFVTPITKLSGQTLEINLNFEVEWS